MAKAGEHSGTYAAKVIVGGGTAGDGGVEDGASVVPHVVGRGVGLGEVAVAQGAAGKVLEVDVERLVVTLAECLFHGKLGGVVEPVGVGGASSSLENELNVARGKVLVENGKLLVVR